MTIHTDGKGKEDVPIKIFSFQSPAVNFTSAQHLTKLQPDRIVKIEVSRNVCQVLHT